MNIKKLEKGDEKDLAYLMQKLDLYYEETSASIEEKIKKATEFIENKQVWGYFVQGSMVGYISIEYFDKNHHNFPSSVFLSELFVLEKFRREKIASKLINFVLNLKYPNTYKYFSLTHSPEKSFLTEFYENLGFKYSGILKDSGNVAMKREITIQIQPVLNNL